MDATLENVVRLMNRWSKINQPFVFLFDFELKKPKIWSFEELTSKKHHELHEVAINFKDSIFEKKQKNCSKKFDFLINKTAFKDYQEAFSQVTQQIQLGNSFLTNLTNKTPIKTNLTLSEIFEYSTAPYNFILRGEFVSFSPEPFVLIENNTISAFPMKGTINANLPDAEKKIINNEKELEEHVTIVDLLRNDLSQVATQVQVKQFRYIEKLATNYETILQVSSNIQGILKPYYMQNLGDLFLRILPAGSVSGAPKTSTRQIISEVEKEPRGYFTGVTGIFDGKNLKSAVLIRYIEEVNGQYFFRSGGGITCKSDVLEEYQEMIQKIYLPW